MSALGLLFAGDEMLWRLNREHRGIDEPTDVLSFPDEGRERAPSPEGGPRYLGDIAVSFETVGRQAAAAGLTLDQELRHVILHGLLHLLGYDHETVRAEAVMRRREEALLGPRIHLDGGAHKHHGLKGAGRRREQRRHGSAATGPRVHWPRPDSPPARGRLERASFQRSDRSTGALPQVAPAAVCRDRRPGSGHHHAAARRRRGLPGARLPVLGAPRHRQDEHGPHPGARRQLHLPAGRRAGQ